MAKSAKIVGPFQIRSEKAKAQSLVELSLVTPYPLKYQYLKKYFEIFDSVKGM